MRHKISAEGRRYLKSAWRALIDSGPSGDLDADLRVALLALLAGGDRRQAADFLRQSAAQRPEKIRELEEPKGLASLPPLALWYRRLRSASAEALIEVESAALLAMARALPRIPSRKRKRNRAITNP
jgi:hypothetical protein